MVGKLTFVAGMSMACLIPQIAALAQSASNSATTPGERGALKGVVTDSTKNPLQGVEVTIVGSGRTVRTDASGGFVFEYIPLGSYRVVVRRLGFRPQSHDVTVIAGSSPMISFVLTAAPQILEAQKVTAGMDMPPGAPQRMFDFYRRRRIGFGTYITRDQIDRAGSVRATLGGVSGVRVFTAPGGQVRGMKFVRCSGSIRDGQSPIAYFLDGLQTTDGVFSFLSDNDIEALEIYKGPASMPPEAAGNACAAVFIWTKR